MKKALYKTQYSRYQQKSHILNPFKIAVCGARVFFHGLETDFISFIKLYIQFKGVAAWTDHFTGSALHQDSKVLGYSNTS